MPNISMNNSISSVIANPTPAPSQLRGRLTLGLIALCFAAPIFLAILFQSPLLNYHPTPTKNMGELMGGRPEAIKAMMKMKKIVVSELKAQ